MGRPRTKPGLLYWKRGRAYADFTGPEYAPWGGKLSALIPEGERFATRDPAVAELLVAKHKERFQKLREKYPRGLSRARGEDPLNRIAPFIGHHIARLRVPRRNGRVPTEKTVEYQRSMLIRAARFFQARKDAARPRGILYLAEIIADDVVAWLDDLTVNPPAGGGMGGRRLASGGTIAKHFHALRRMLRRAWKQERIPVNPVDKVPDEELPTGGPSPTHHLEIPEAALALEAARRSVEHRVTHAEHENYVRMATFLLTGGSGNDVDGLEKADLDWRNERIWFRENATRRGIMKGRARRSVPFFPQLQEVLRAYLSSDRCPPGAALFRGGNMDRWLDGIARSVGMPEKHLRVRVFRVTYATARVQTLDNGAPIAERTLRAELGHRSSQMLNEVYAHVGSARRRTEHVEYRWADHEAEMGHRIHGAARLTGNALAALAALRGRGALASVEWRRRCGLAAGSFVYVRNRLVERGYVLAQGQGHGAKFRITLAGAGALAAALPEQQATGG